MMMMIIMMRANKEYIILLSQKEKTFTFASFGSFRAAASNSRTALAMSPFSNRASPSVNGSG